MEGAKLIETHVTQTAVNSSGKTNEATKHIKEPLKSGQKDPDDKSNKSSRLNLNYLLK